MEGSGMTSDREQQRRREGVIFLILFALTIPAANWFIGHVGTTCIANGPCVVPVAPGLMAPSGVMMVGVALVLRDLVQRRLGAVMSALAILCGTALSALLAPPSLVLASGVAFLLSEFADLAVYTPLARADWLLRRGSRLSGGRHHRVLGGGGGGGGGGGRADRRLAEGWVAVSLLGDALVLFSGGQDSTVCLAWALERFARVETIGFDYGQRHAVELAVRPGIRERLSQLSAAWRERLGEDHVVRIDALAAISETALTRDVAIEISESGLPTTFVPGRNLVFFSFAGALAYRRGLKHLVAGMCETDFSGYPDCRDDTIKAMQLALTLGMDRRFVIHTPLMWIDKAATFALAQDIGGAPLIELLLAETHTCYLGDREHRHAWGFGCGECPACRLRAEGYAKWKAAA